MGDSTGSMLIFFAIIMVVYVLGALIYTMVQRIRKAAKERKWTDG